MTRASLSLLVCLAAAPLPAADHVAEARARAALAISHALRPVAPQPVAPEPYEDKPELYPDPFDPYKAARELAVRRKRPLVVFVKQPAKNVLGCVTVSVGHFRLAPAGKCVVVGAWRDGELVEVATLKGRPKVRTILDAARKNPKVKPPARKKRRPVQPPPAPPRQFQPFAPQRMSAPAPVPMMRSGGGRSGGC